MKKISICIIFVLVLAGCSSTKKLPPDMQERIERTKESALPIITEDEKDKKWEKFEVLDLEEEEDRTLQDWNKEEQDIGAITGMAWKGEELITTDVKKSQLVIFDRKGNVKKIIGKLGNGKLEFQNPTDVAIGGTNLYILDNGNKRITILDFQFQFVEHININQEYLNNENVYESIAVSQDDEIYICGKSNLRKPGILYFDQVTKEQQLIEENFCGYLNSYEGKVYGINSGEMYLPRREDERSAFAVAPGNIYIFQLNKDKLQIKKQISSCLYCFDFLMMDNSIFCISPTYGCILELNSEGQPFLRVAEWLDSRDGQFAIHPDGTILLSDGKTFQILYLK